MVSLRGNRLILCNAGGGSNSRAMFGGNEMAGGDVYSSTEKRPNAPGTHTQITFLIFKFQIVIISTRVYVKLLSFMLENNIFGIFKHPQEDPLLLNSKCFLPLHLK